jgi:hypothetical protein
MYEMGAFAGIHEDCGGDVQYLPNPHNPHGPWEPNCLRCNKIVFDYKAMSWEERKALAPFEKKNENLVS